MQELTPYVFESSYQQVEPNFFTAKEIADNGPTFREYYAVITKRWLLIITVLICVIAVTGLIVFLMPATYTASSTLLIEPQAPQILGIRELETEASGDTADDTFYGTEYKILQSRSLAARVIRELDLQNKSFLGAGKRASQFKLPAQTRNFKDSAIATYEPDAGTLGINYNVIDAYLKRLKIQSDPGTRLVTVSFSTPNPVLSARIVNAHVQAYIKRGTELHSEANVSAERYLRTKLTELQAQVEKSEAELNSYRRQRGIVSDSADDNNKVVMGRLADLNKALTDDETQRIALGADARLIATRDYDALPAVSNDTLVQTLRQQQARLAAEYASMADQYKPNYPPLAELGAQLQETETRVREEIHRVAAAVELSYAAAVEREKELNAAINEEKNRALALNDASLQDAILARAVDTNRKLYRNVLERMNQVGMAAGVSASNVSVLDDATPRIQPSSPKKLLTLTTSSIFALFVGVSCAFFLERFDDTFKDGADVERYLRLRSLAAVPNIRQLTKSTNGARKHLLRPFTPDRGEADSRVIIAAENNGFSAAAEAYRALRLSLMLSRPTPPKVVLITSGVPNEGKTVTAINTAVAFAQMGSKVALIDADLRNSKCHKLLNIVNTEGLTEILTGQRRLDEVAQPTQVEGLVCITAGSRPLNPGLLLGSSAMIDVLSVLKDRYDFILIDSAPVLAVTDALHLVSMVDGVVLVVGPDVSRQMVKLVCGRLIHLHAPLLGIVRNRVDTRIHGSSEHYYYPTYNKSSNLNGIMDQREG
jgi:capsular exopolysaccharide synthesis family protein